MNDTGNDSHDSLHQTAIDKAVEDFARKVWLTAKFLGA